MKTNSLAGLLLLQIAFTIFAGFSMVFQTGEKVKVKIKYCDVVLDLGNPDLDVLEDLFKGKLAVSGLEARRMLIMGCTMLDEFEIILKVVDYDFNYFDERNNQWERVEEFQIDCFYLEIEEVVI